MYVKVPITTLLLTLTSLICFHAHGFPYAVILEIDNSTETAIHLRGQLSQPWRQLKLIPLPKGTELISNSLADILGKRLPEVMFTKQLAKDNAPIYTANSSIPNGIRSYISWLISTSSPNFGDDDDQPHSTTLIINKLFERLSPSPQTKIKVFSTTTPGQNLISIRLPDNSEAWHFRLSEVKHRTGEVSYTITPLRPEDPEDIDTPLQDDIDTLTTQFRAMSLPDVYHNKLRAAQPPRAKTPQGSAQIIPGSRPLPSSPISPLKKKLKLPYEDHAFLYVLRGEDYFVETEGLKLAIRQRPELLNWEHVKTLQGSKSEFGAVQIYRPKTNGTALVIKKIKEKNKSYKNLSRETTLLNKLRHKNIIAFEGMALRSASNGEKELWMAITYMPHGDMESLISDSPATLTNDNIKTIIKNLIEAVFYLHRNDIIHRDIKPGNILLMLENESVVQVKLSDFGFAASTDELSATQGACGSAEYAPPELLQHQPRFHLKALDIWPIGVTVYASYVGLDIYPDSKTIYMSDAVKWRLAHPDLEVASPKSLQRLQRARFTPPKEAKALIQACCQPNPGDRPDIFTLSQNPFIRQPIKTKIKALTTSSRR